MNTRIPYRLVNSDELTQFEIDQKLSEHGSFTDESRVPVSLFKLDTGDYRVIVKGELKPILFGHDYLLLLSDVAEVLCSNTTNQIEFNPIKILRKSTNQEWLNYSEIKISNEIDKSEYFEKEYSGLLIFHLMNSTIYISHELKIAIGDSIFENSGIKLNQDLPFFVG